MTDPPIQQRGFPGVQPVPTPASSSPSSTGRRPSASQQAVHGQVSLLTASLQQHSLLSQALKREGNHVGEGTLSIVPVSQTGIKPWETINGEERCSSPLLRTQEHQGNVAPPPPPSSTRVMAAAAGPKPILFPASGPGLPPAPALTPAHAAVQNTTTGTAHSLQQQQLQVPKPILLHRSVDNGTVAAAGSIFPAAINSGGRGGGVTSEISFPFFHNQAVPPPPPSETHSDPLLVNHTGTFHPSLVVKGEAAAPPPPPPKSILQHDSAHDAPNIGAGTGASQHIIFHPAFNPPPSHATVPAAAAHPQQQQQQQPSLLSPNPTTAIPLPPNLARKSSLKFAIAAPPAHLTPLPTGSRRGSLDVALVAGAAAPSGSHVPGGVVPDLAAVVEQRLLHGHNHASHGPAPPAAGSSAAGEGSSSPPSRTLSRTSSRHLYSEEEGRVIDDIMEEEDEEEEEEYDEDGVSGSEDEDEYDEDLSEDDDDDEETQSGANWSGYEEDSEAGLSDEMDDDDDEDDNVEYIKKESRIVSPPATFTLGRYQRRADAVEEEEEEDLSGATPSRMFRTHPARSPMPNTASSTHFSSIPNTSTNNTTTAQLPGFAFARPTNYRRRRPASVVSNDGGLASPGSSPFVAGAGTIVPAAASTSFVKIDPHERVVHRGHGAVQIVDAIPPSPQSRGTTTAGGGGAYADGRPRQKPKRANTLTRHCSPPPAPAGHTTALPPTSNSTIPRAPPAELSPSAIRMQVRRGVSDSPSKKKLRARQQGMNLFGPNSTALVRAALMTDDDDEEGHANLAPRETAMVVTATTTEDEAGLEARRTPGSRTELTATRGWRSDDALFAVPTVRRRYPNISVRTTSNRSPGPPPLVTGESRSRKASVVSLVVQPTFLSSAPPSDVEHPAGAGRRGSESVVDSARYVLRRTSEKVTQPFSLRASSTMTSPHVHDADLPHSSGPPPNGLLSPIEPSLSLFSASSPCPPAIDDTPALALAASFLPTTPVDQLLHEKLAGTPSRRRGSDAALVATAAAPQVRSTEGSGSDGYRSRASSALGFRSDDSRSVLHHASYQQQHKDSAAAPSLSSHHNQQPNTQAVYTHNHLRPDGGDTEHDAQHLAAKQAIKSKPIKCPSPRRQTQGNEVRI
ncbi:hypothetical protein QFC21_002174 [Naganishia friedmannii]|uniref:Uncharacterized protein n=1 Tax=Naganishia friedmannii TaxID=89922 RepID=A0ACC2VZZ3_9TREE|nr:hypothetical protein QFC21_002174 [Naganishia friedmannii]